MMAGRRVCAWSRAIFTSHFQRPSAISLRGVLRRRVTSALKCDVLVQRGWTKHSRNRPFRRSAQRKLTVASRDLCDDPASVGNQARHDRCSRTGPSQVHFQEEQPMEAAIESPQAQPAEPANRRSRRLADRSATVSLPAAEPSPELIARRAYELFERRGGGHGRDVEDWLEAERELLDPVRESGLLTREAHEPPAN